MHVRVVLARPASIPQLSLLSLSQAEVQGFVVLAVCHFKVVMVTKQVKQVSEPRAKTADRLSSNFIDLRWLAAALASVGGLCGNTVSMSIISVFIL